MMTEVVTCQLLHYSNEERDDELRAIARLEQSSQGVLDGIGLASLGDDVLEFHLNVLLTTNLLQNLHHCHE